MKTTIYSVSVSDQSMLKREMHVQLEKQLNLFKSANHLHGKMPPTERYGQMAKLATIRTCFLLFTQDQLARIEAVQDKLLTFADHCGEIFCPVANPDIDPKELERQRKNEYQRFRRQGCWGQVLYVDGCEESSIWGFVGRDFFGSGYDDDMYTEAFDLLSKSYPDYVNAAVAAVQSVIDETLDYMVGSIRKVEK